MRHGNITQSVQRDPAIVFLSQEQYCVNSYMMQRRWEALFRRHYCQRRQIEYTRYTNKNSYKTQGEAFSPLLLGILLHVV
jgi:hypothetical protein